MSQQPHITSSNALDAKPDYPPGTRPGTPPEVFSPSGGITYPGHDLRRAGSVCLTITVPVGCSGGSTFQVLNPYTHRPLTVMVPGGFMPGMKFHIQLREIDRISPADIRRKHLSRRNNVADDDYDHILILYLMFVIMCTSGLTYYIMEHHLIP